MRRFKSSNLKRLILQATITCPERLQWLSQSSSIWECSRCRIALLWLCFFSLRRSPVSPPSKLLIPSLALTSWPKNRMALWPSKLNTSSARRNQAFERSISPRQPSIPKPNPTAIPRTGWEPAAMLMWKSCPTRDATTARNSRPESTFPTSPGNLRS